MDGWVKIHRSFSKWEWIDSPNHVAVFVHLLINATHKPSQWRGVNLLPGQVLTGRKRIAKCTGLTEQSVRTVLKDLKSTNEVTSKSLSKFSIISITNWNKYQEANQVSNQQVTSNQPASNHIQECKEHKNVKNNIYIDDLLDIYNNYPKKEGKKKGIAKLKTLITSEDKLNEFRLACNNYKKIIKRDERAIKYIKQFSVFVNNYEDYLDLKDEDLLTPEKKLAARAKELFPLPGTPV